MINGGQEEWALGLDAKTLNTIDTKGTNSDVNTLLFTPTQGIYLGRI